MQYPWTMADVSAAWKACNRYYAESPIICRALCGHTIEEEHDWFELLYNIIGVWLIIIEDIASGIRKNQMI